MKTLIKSLALALSIGFLTSVASFSEAKPIGHPSVVASYKSGIYTSIGGNVNIALDKQTGGVVEIQLKNTEGKVLYNQHVGKKETKSRTRLNVNELPDGVYTVEITNGVETTTHNVTISTPQPQTPTRLVALN
ncbi:T9SS type A sorting domain-containing protein [Spirosoma flavum]|uniref:T9SS type A sorting domain-containing protein n=1 Tax=Spirosoma flavum TaxID=2048557 RepID=A0ABW6ABE1_9BACT